MKSIYNIYESILDDIDAQMNNGESDIILSYIFSNKINDRQKGFELLQNKIKSSKSKKINSTSKMKSSESYFVQFGRSIKIENGEATNEIVGPVQNLRCLKKNNLDYHFVSVCAYESNFGGLAIHSYQMSNWRYIKDEFQPKAYDVYEISKDMEGLIDTIMKTAEKEMYKR